MRLLADALHVCDIFRKCEMPTPTPRDPPLDVGPPQINLREPLKLPSISPASTRNNHTRDGHKLTANRTEPDTDALQKSNVHLVPMTNRFYTCPVQLTF